MRFKARSNGGDAEMARRTGGPADEKALEYTAHSPAGAAAQWAKEHPGTDGILVTWVESALFTRAELPSLEAEEDAAKAAHMRRVKPLLAIIEEEEAQLRGAVKVVMAKMASRDDAELLGHCMWAFQGRANPVDVLRAIRLELKEYAL